MAACESCAPDHRNQTSQMGCEAIHEIFAKLPSGRWQPPEVDSSRLTKGRPQLACGHMSGQCPKTVFFCQVSPALFHWSFMQEFPLWNKMNQTSTSPIRCLYHATQRAAKAGSDVNGRSEGSCHRSNLFCLLSDSLAARFGWWTCGWWAGLSGNESMETK